MIGALTAHAGLGRVILTSRRVPAGLAGLAGGGGGRAVGRRGAAARPRTPAPAALDRRRGARHRPHHVPGGSPRRAEHRPGPPEAAGTRRRPGRAARSGSPRWCGRRPGMAGAGRPAGRILRRRGGGRRTGDGGGLLARPRRLDHGRRGHAGTGRAGPVLVPVLPGRTRPAAARPRRQLGRPVAAARPRRPAARPGPALPAVAAARPGHHPRENRMARRVVRGPPRGRRGRTRPGREAVPGRGRRRGRRLLGRRLPRRVRGGRRRRRGHRTAGARRAGRRPLPAPPAAVGQAAAMLERRLRPGPVAGQRGGGAARHPADRPP